MGRFNCLYIFTTGPNPTQAPQIQDYRVCSLNISSTYTTRMGGIRCSNDRRIVISFVARPRTE